MQRITYRKQERERIRGYAQIHVHLPNGEDGASHIGLGFVRVNQRACGANIRRLEDLAEDRRQGDLVSSHPQVSRLYADGAIERCFTR